ncbi:hypothetical protein BURPS1106B_1869 [Burkholderia pseudomallei 1106b]|uniref:Uncharacterized protein n=1 Tax=Burkholderia pseudomallei (strain 1106a) TaxID=357348 RepID=A3P1F3_BURP0|nr:hypothetical protein BURPS1106A_A0120 [Burkholderia pseudomallei 1106a]AFR18058.1 hypothetical protein BPC006_II0118 [Burkholderia pseudomallei BPC006]EES21277.1 hypothetical protein BURPS1106B_1869 [Burkholderia pseudomallei 1106b]
MVPVSFDDRELEMVTHASAIALKWKRDDVIFRKGRAVIPSD